MLQLQLQKKEIFPNNINEDETDKTCVQFFNYLDADSGEEKRIKAIP
jgi:hypothetical protein